MTTPRLASKAVSQHMVSHRPGAGDQLVTEIMPFDHPEVSHLVVTSEPAPSNLGRHNSDDTFVLLIMYHANLWKAPNYKLVVT